MSRDALVVGINRYDYLQSLKAPAVDAEAIAQRLEQDGNFRVRRLPEAITQTDDIKKPLVAQTHPVSQLQLEQALEHLFLPSSTQAPDTALFYFSGHGIPDAKGYDKGYLATSETNPNQPRAGLSLRWLQWLLSESPVKQQIIWLDCCHSGALLVNVGAANPGNGNSRDRCFVASSRDFETSWEDLNSEYSVLTRALLDGLDPSRLSGQSINTADLVAYVHKALKRELQTPVCTNFGEAIPLTWSWQKQEETVEHPTEESKLCPYKGLEFFDCNDEDPKYFFGRDQLVGELLDLVRTKNFLALVGASGNGKSSVLRAGLLHQLKLGRRIAGSEQWRIRVTRPDKQPMQNLALAFVEEGLSDLDRAEALGRASGLLKEGSAGLQRLVQASSAPRVILVIDQFEEVFTRCEDLEEREAFFECLIGALSETNDKLCLILAMRSDFIGKCLEREYGGLAERMQQTVTVLPLKPEELKAAICKPAQQVGLGVEPALLTEILNDVAGAPGSLPLLQYTLKELWQRRQDNQLTLSAYQALGGISGTLDQRATEIYKSFEPDEQLTVQHIFQQLTQLGEGTEDTRRRVFQADLVAEPKHSMQRVERVIARLAEPETRLLVTSEVISKGNDSGRMAIVDVAHEALIRHWTLLRQWIEQNRDLLRKQRKIEASAVAWRGQGAKTGYLLQGLPLNEAIQFNMQQKEAFPLSESPKVFVHTIIRYRPFTRLKIASWLIIPASLLVGVAEHNLRESRVNAAWISLDKEGGYEEKQAVQSLVQGCYENKEGNLPHYVAERLFGNCRSLFQAPLNNANLSSANLRDANLRSANLSSANLSSADLSDAYLSSANLSDAYLISANLRSANLRSADLFSAYLSDANLSDANLISANLRDADLSDANLRSANLISAYLRDANLSDAYLISANLRDANLSSADLSDAYLSSANLSDAYLISANLRDADLISAYLRDADLSDANLRDADLSNAFILNTDLRTAKLLPAQLEGDNAPLICNSPLPLDFTIDHNRDCAQLAAALHERYSFEFQTIEAAEKFVTEQRKKQWE